jgi:hypothetical protein
MTSKRDTKRKSKPKKKRPKLEKERLKDLSADSAADEVRGGAVGAFATDRCFCTIRDIDSCR